MTEPKPRFTDRETARRMLTQKIKGQQKVRADIEAERHLAPGLRRTFTTIDPNYLIDDAEWRLRWIDCAPEGANHQVAPMQDKLGVPCGTAWDENLGPNEAVRNARIKRGLHPISGQRMDGVYFAVPTHYTIGREFDTYRDAEAHARTTISEIDGCPGTYTRAFVDTRQRTDRGDDVIVRTEVTL